MECGLVENMSCDRQAFSGGLPLLPEFSSLSGSETAGSGETLHRMNFGRRRILPREILFSLDPAASTLRSNIWWEIGTS